MSVHQERVASLLRRTIQEILGRGLADPRIRGIVSVTAVRVSDDLADATVMVTIMPESEVELTLHGLRAAAGHIRRIASDRMALRRTPRLAFRLDKGARNEARVLAALAEDPVRPAADTPSPDTPSPDTDGGGGSGTPEARIWTSVRGTVNEEHP
ncbi:MAG: 30S ribosome-binding factor RbfA [Phycisphaeraceae bacterium]|nr:30S ribosome-binding factor RbfA [Phycisphaeraceae bacterium]